MRGIPQIYYGDEIGMVGSGDPDNRRDFPGGFAGDARNAFTAAGRSEGQQDLFAYWQKMLKLRQEHPALRGGNLWQIFSDKLRYVFVRESGDDKLLVVFDNASEEEMEEGGAAKVMVIALADTPVASAKSVEALVGSPAAKMVEGGVEVQLRPKTVGVYRLR